jgi:hypothetical protein
MLMTALVLPLWACSKHDTAAAQSTQQAGSNAAPDDATAQLATKLNAYVDCFNTADGSARDSAERYVSWIGDLDKGPTGKERNVNTLGDLTPYELETCTKSVGQALSAKPALPALDAAAKQYLADFTALVPLVSQAHAYYSQEDYKDDGFAKGQQMHQPLMMAFGRFIKASDVYGAEVEKENDALTAAQLVDLEKTQGRHTAYYRLALMSQGKLLATQLNAEAPDLAQVTKAVDAYGALVDESAKANADEQGKPISWSVFQTTAGTFLKDCKDRMRRVRDKTPYSHGEQMLMEGTGSSGWMVSGSPDRVFKSYNTLVEASNRL